MSVGLSSKTFNKAIYYNIPGTLAYVLAMPF